MRLDDDNSVLELVEKYLNEMKPGGSGVQYDLIVDRREDTHWYIVVKPSRAPRNRISFYSKLAEVEQAIKDEVEADVLFIPAA